MTHSVRYRQSAPRVAAIRAAALAVALLAASPAAMAQAVPTPTTAQATPAPEAPASTRSVNIAIVALGSLWILLMVRRVQSVAALRHAEAGH